MVRTRVVGDAVAVRCIRGCLGSRFIGGVTDAVTQVVPGADSEEERWAAIQDTSVNASGSNSSTISEPVVPGLLFSGGRPAFRMCSGFGGHGQLN